MTVKELIDKLQQFDEDKLVLVEDTEYKEFQAIEAVPMTAREANDKGYRISNIESIKVGTKTTNTTLTCLTGFEVHCQAGCVKPENFDLNISAAYAQIEAEDKIWEGLGFVLQWAKYGLKR